MNDEPADRGAEEQVDQIGSGRGRKHGTSSSQPFDRWFRYPAGFASDYAETLLYSLNIPQGGLVIDCFAGSGVAGTAARHAGYEFYGIEAHPLIAELAQLKLDRPAGGKRLTDAATEVSEAAAALTVARISSGELRAQQEPDLVQRCFDANQLEELVALRDCVNSAQDDLRPYLKWALLGCLRDLASAKVGWPYQRPALTRKPIHSSLSKRFMARVKLMHQDLSAAPIGEIKCTVRCGDSRKLESWRNEFGRLADGCITSPPYLNNFDYADATRLELYFWGEVTSWSAMCADVRSGMITATTQQSSVGAASTAATKLEALPGVADRIGSVVKELQVQRAARKRGKEYDRVIPDYFFGIHETLVNLASHLKPGAPSAWLIGDSAPYGVYVNTPQIIGEIASQAGFVVERDLPLRHRGKRWGNGKHRHSVPLSERLLTFRRT